MRQTLGVLDQVMRRERWLLNAQSASTARVGETVAIAASMGKDERTELDFLPFPAEARDRQSRISEAAATTVRWLIKDRLLPLDVAAMLMEDLPKHHEEETPD
jgi:hypothetical protein